ncbi:MAG: PcfJ domain-containing protein [Gammaproteobacteria bacterium]
MRYVDLHRIVAWSQVRKPFLALGGLSWSLELGTGTLHIGARRIPLPEGWIHADPDARLIRPMLDSLQQTLATAPRITASEQWRKQWTWNGKIRENVHRTRKSSTAIPDFIRDRLSELVRSSVRELNIAFGPSWAGVAPFMSALEDAFIQTLMSSAECAGMNDAMDLLLLRHDEDVLRLVDAMDTDSVLLRDISRLERTLRHARSRWPEGQKHLVDWIPFAGGPTQPSDAMSVHAWLREQGLSRTSLSRLHRLPGQALERLHAVWVRDYPPDLTACFRWLNRLLSLAAQHDGELAPEGLLLGCAIAGSAGIVASGLDCPQNQRHSVNYFTEPMHGLWKIDHSLAATYATTVLKAVIASAGSHLLDIEGDVSQVRDWIRGRLQDDQAPRLTRKDLGPDWATLMRRQQRWHLERRPTVLEAQAGGISVWNEPCADFVFGYCAIVGLRNSRDLFEEGSAMHHCVYGYRSDCASGKSRIFSIRNAATGKRIGTAEFKKRKREWQLVQYRGLQNRQLIGPDCRALDARQEGAINELARRLNS